jgi:hypothetical protein
MFAAPSLRAPIMPPSGPSPIRHGGAPLAVALLLLPTAACSRYRTAPPAALTIPPRALGGSEQRTISRRRTAA